MAAIIAVGGFSGIALNAAQGPQPQENRTPIQSAATGPVEELEAHEPSPELRTATVQKAALLEQDLALSPQDSFLLAALAETYLYRAFAEYQTSPNPQEASRWLRRANSYVERLRDHAPFASYRLREVIGRFPNLRFNTLEWPTITASLWPLQSGRYTIFSTPAPGGIPFVRRRRDVTGLPPTMNSPTAVPMGGDRLPLAGTSAAGYPGSAPVWPGPGLFSTAPDPNQPRLQEPGSDVGDDELRLKRLRQDAAAHPTDLLRADKLVGELTRLAGSYQPAGPQGKSQRLARRRLEEAAEVSVRTAHRARLRVHRAAFYAAAADAHRQLEQWEQHYELLHLTAQNVPFAPAVWHDLKTAALRLGKLDESLAASRNEKKWRFPGIEPAYRGGP